MRTVFSTLFALVFATSAFAEQATVTEPLGPVISGGVEVEFTRNDTTDKIESETTLELGINAGDVAFGGFSIKSTDGNTFELDEWMLGTEVGVATVSFGDQGGVFVEALSDYAALADPNATTKESLQVSVEDIRIALGFGDIENDVSDLENVQAAYTLSLDGIGDVTASGDYNLDSEQFTLGGRLDSELGAGATVSYAEATEVIEYEVDYSINGAMVYLNGDQDDLAQNAGLGYGVDFNGLNLGAKMNYNIDTSDITPSVSVGFSF
jgi:hypothetical protein